MSSYQNVTIKKMDDITAVRTRPGMYVGDPTEGPHQMGRTFLWWLTALIGKRPQREVRLRLSSDGSYAFEVLGQGFSERIEEVVEILTVLHAGFLSHSMISIAPVNMLSRWFVYTNWSQGTQQRLCFEDGIPTQRTEEPSEHPDGFRISFLPDLLIFPAPTPGSDRLLIERFYELASIPGMELRVEIEGAPTRHISSLHHEGTIQRLCSEEAIFPKMLSLSGVKDNVSVNATLYWTLSPDETKLSFCNGYQTPSGGAHLTGLRVGLKRAILTYAGERSFALPEKAEYRRGLACVISVVMAQPMFGDTAREKLVSIEARRVAESLVYEGVLGFLREHSTESLALLEHLSSRRLSSNSISLKLPVPESPARALSDAYNEQRSEVLQKMLCIAEDPNRPEEQLEMLVSCLAPEVSRALAKNPNTPIRILCWVARDFPDEVLQNPIMPLLWLSEPDWPLVGWRTLASLAASPLAPEMLLVMAAESNDCEAMKAALYHPRTPKELRQRLLQDQRLQDHLRAKGAPRKP